MQVGFCCCCGCCDCVIDDYDGQYFVGYLGIIFDYFGDVVVLYSFDGVLFNGIGLQFYIWFVVLQYLYLYVGVNFKGINDVMCRFVLGVCFVIFIGILCVLV